MSMKIAINGAGGRMGRAVIAAAETLGGFEIVGGTARAGDSCVGQDLGALASIRLLGINVKDEMSCFGGAEAVIDFSAPEGALEALNAAPAGAAVVTGTTGLSAEQQKAVEDAAKTRPVVQAGNFSIGVNLLSALVKMAASRLPEEWDIEIEDIHHRRKADAPSGTALMLGRAAAEARGVELDRHMAVDRHGVRKAGDIGFSVSRAGGVIGEHTVSFTSDRERVALSHSALDRAIFAEGALHAARWAAGRAPGLYDMADVLELRIRGLEPSFTE